ncbi:hypothetical protein BJF90_11675 [Pseudonocardia sp. CNS-004]|nr:hypothetical protein BJF90_11675 [Pseudonocardia sp. CNS-004]
MTARGAATVAVVGGGISGLAAAHRLRTLLGPDARIEVLEQRDRIGGVLHTVDLAGVAFDVGAEAFLARRPEVPALLAELGLTDAVVHPTGAKASVRAAGRTGPLPPATLLASRPAPRASTGCCPPPGSPRWPPSLRSRCPGSRGVTWRWAGCCARASGTRSPTASPTRCSAASTRAGSTRSACAPPCPASPRPSTRARVP